MKREMKRSFLFILIILTLASCGYLDIYKKKEISKLEVANTIMIDDYLLLNTYLSENVSPNLKIKGEPLIDVALKYNSIDSLKLLITRGANINDLYFGKSPLCYVKSLEALKILLKNNIFIQDDTFAYYIKNMPTSYLEEIIKAHDFNNFHNIMLAINYGNPEIIRFLSKNGFIFNMKDKNLNYPIYYVDNEEMILTLLDVTTYDINAININNENVLGMVLLKSAKLGYIKVIHKLLELGVNINYMAYSRNALMIAKLYNPKAYKYIKSLYN